MLKSGIKLPAFFQRVYGISDRRLRLFCNISRSSPNVSINTDQARRQIINVRLETPSRNYEDLTSLRAIDTDLKPLSSACKKANSGEQASQYGHNDEFGQVASLSSIDIRY